MNFPDFIIIGAAKAGTTSLHYYLSLHPEIKMAGENGLEFFIKDHDGNGELRQYRALFKGTPQTKVFGESTPAYTRYPRIQRVPERIYALVPKVKLIYLVRDPLERLISHYVQSYVKDAEHRSFETAVGNFQDNLYLDGSKYSMQIEQYLRYFDLKNILIVDQKALWSDRRETLKSIFKFLNVDPSFYSPHYSAIRHPSEGKRRKNEFGARLSASSFMQWVPKLPSSIRWHVENMIYFPFSSPVPKPVLKKDMRERLIQFLQDDINRFRQLTGQSFESWSL